MTIDERLEFLVQSTESLHSSVHDLTRDVQKLTADVQKLTETVSKHEKRWELVRKVIQAGLQAGLDNEGEGE